MEYPKEESAGSWTYGRKAQAVVCIQEVGLRVSQ